MAYSKQIVYLSDAQYQELVTEGSITVSGTTITYNANNIYVTPQSEPITGVQVNGTSVVSNGVANVPLASPSAPGTIKVQNSNTTEALNNGGTVLINDVLYIIGATASQMKNGTDAAAVVSASRQHLSVFYGLAKAAGDTTQKNSTNDVGVYTDTAKAAIQTMLGVEAGVSLVESVSGTTPSITALPNVRYVCGEVSTISITPPAGSTCDILFESGSTATLLTVPNGVIFPSWFDATSLDTNTIYEIMITDGVYGSVMSWAS